MSDSRLARRDLLVAVLLVLGFVGSRVTALLNRVILPDNDSTVLVDQIGSLARDGPSAYLQFSADVTPAYLFSGALLARVAGLDPALAGRLVSLLASALTAYLVYRIAVLLFSRGTGAVAVALVIVNAALAYWAVSILTEPLYVALLYLGVYLLLQRGLSVGDSPRWGDGEPAPPGQVNLYRSRTAIELGVVFALAFLTRFEGIIYFALVPLWVGLHMVSNRVLGRTWKRLAGWTAIFAVAFSLVAAPQVWKVSSQTGTFMLNGRQVWAAYLGTSGPEVYDARIHGLDYADDEVNIRYLQSHTDELPEAPRNLAAMAGLVADNLELTYEERLPELLGLLVVAFAFLGAAALHGRPQWRFVVLFVASFLGLSMVPSLTYNVVARHLMFLLPLALVLAAQGVVEAGRYLRERSPRPWPWVAAIVVLVALPAVPNLVRGIAKPYATPTWAPAPYDPRAYEPVIDDLRSHADDPGSVVVASRQGFFTYHAGTNRVLIPHADYDALLRYLRLRGADYIFIDASVSGHPFMEEFRVSGHTDFELVSSHDSAAQGSLALYRLRPDERPTF